MIGHRKRCTAKVLAETPSKCVIPKVRTGKSTPPFSPRPRLLGSGSAAPSERGSRRCKSRWWRLLATHPASGGEGGSTHRAKRNVATSTRYNVKHHFQARFHGRSADDTALPQERREPVHLEACHCGTVPFAPGNNHGSRPAIRDTPGAQGRQTPVSEGYWGHAAPHGWEPPENPPPPHTHSTSTCFCRNCAVASTEYRANNDVYCHIRQAQRTTSLRGLTAAHVRTRC